MPDLTVPDLFAAAGLAPCGPIPWTQKCGETRPGVYVVTVEGEIVYIGRARNSLSRRIGQFYRHKYGAKRPHRGGQDLLRLVGDRHIYWCAADNPAAAET